ncbi:MAG: DUF2062 domain-containing protein [Rhizobiaceae bacterium]
MLFRRRNPASYLERLRIAVWPRVSFARSAKYVLNRVLRLATTPHAMAAGFAAGAAVSFLPLLGLHFVLAALLAFVIRGNMIASAFGTAVGNPVTFPFIWGSTYAVGEALLYQADFHAMAPVNLVGALRHLDFAALWQPLIKPMMIGAIPLGILVWVIFYFAVRAMLGAFHQRRLHRLHNKQRRTAPAAAESLTGQQ